MEQHLSQYRIFYEVAKAGNISKAAFKFSDGLADGGLAYIQLFGSL